MNFRSLLDRALGTKTLSKEEAKEVYKSFVAQAVPKEPPPVVVNADDENVGYPDNPQCAQVVFSITKEGEALVHMAWTDQEKPTANALAHLLHCLNSGQFLKLCSSYLQGLAQHEPSEAPFIKDAVKIWNEILAADRPIMKPSQVFPSITAQVVNIKEEE